MIMTNILLYCIVLDKHCQDLCFIYLHQTVAPFGVSTAMTGYQKPNFVTLTARDFVRTSLQYLTSGDKTHGSIRHTVLVKYTM